MFTSSSRRAQVLGSLAVLFTVSLGCGVGPDEADDTTRGEDTPETGVVRSALCAAITIKPVNELMITAVSVVEDPVRTTWTQDGVNVNAGVWTFGKLMTDMAGANEPSAFVRNWLSKWEFNQTVNTFTVGARTEIRSLVINSWPRVPGTTRLDLKKAPFRLLAIVNRMDLRKLSEGNAGEGRFVFGVLDPAGNPTQFTVILEYKLPATTSADVVRWAKDWHFLSTKILGSEDYRKTLQVITDRFAKKGIAPTRPNGSAISQVRSNEIALAGPWQMREFHVSSATGQLIQATVNQTPSIGFNNTATLANYINTFETEIIAGRQVPMTFSGQAFRGASSEVPGGFFWNAPGIRNPLARHRLSIDTCNGCHDAETATTFLHVAPRSRGVASQLSAFLTGESVPDPVTGTPRTLNELSRRSDDLENILCASLAGTPVKTETARSAPH